MLTRLALTIRAILLLAATVSFLPSLEGTVLCHHGDGELSIEPGSARCAPPVETSGTREPAGPTVSDGCCGPCVDVPLDGSGPAIRTWKPSASQPVLHPQAVLPTVLREPSIATTSFGIASRIPSGRHSTSHTITPLRC